MKIIKRFIVFVLIFGSTQLLSAKGFEVYFNQPGNTGYELDYPLLPSRGVIYRNQNPDIFHFDGKFPITIGCAGKVGEIMKYLDQAEKPQIRYAFYI